MIDKIAIIDLGSNSVRCGIYEKKSSGKILQIDSIRHTVRLSEGLITDNLLKKPAMERTLQAFLNMKTFLDMKYKGIKIVAVATEAMRRAKNSDIFKNAVKNTTGIEIEILDGETETKYGLFGAKLSAKCDNFYMLDTGGGSFELALCENGNLKSHTCLPYGAVVLTETFHPDEKGTDELDKFMNKVFDTLPWVDKNGYPIVLLGGSNRVLGKLYKGTSSEERQDGLKIPANSVNEIIEKLETLTPEQRMELAGMEKNRVDIITSGVAPLKTLMERSGACELIVSTNSLREGIANEYLK